MSNGHMIALHIPTPASWKELLDGGASLMVVPLTDAEVAELRGNIISLGSTIEQILNTFEPLAAKGDLGARLMEGAMRERLNEVNRVKELLGRAYFAPAGSLDDSRGTIQ